MSKVSSVIVLHVLFWRVQLMVFLSASSDITNALGLWVEILLYTTVYV